MKVEFSKQNDPESFSVMGPIHTSYYLDDGAYLEREIGRADGIDAYWINGHRVFQRVFERRLKGETW